MRFRYAFLCLMAFMLAFTMLVFGAVSSAQTDSGQSRTNGNSTSFDQAP